MPVSLISLQDVQLHSCLGPIQRTFLLLAAAPGPDRDAMIKMWCVSVWKAYSTSHEAIKILAQTYHL